MTGVLQRWISSVGVGCLAGLCVVSCGCWGSGPQSMRAEVAAALGAVRPSPGRVSGLRYTPLPRTYSPPPPTRKLQAIGLSVQKKAERLRSPAALGNQAVLDLAVGRLDRAIADLDEAVQKAPTDAQLLRDLTACYLARGDLGGLFF